MRRLLPVALVVILVFGAAPAHAKPAGKIRHFINHARVSRGIPALVRSDALVIFARDEVRRIARTTELVHSSTQPCAYWGEDIGVTPYGAWALFKAWMHSAPHRANILNGRFRRIGVAAVRADGYLWAAVEFCR